MEKDVKEIINKCTELRPFYEILNGLVTAHETAPANLETWYYAVDTLFKQYKSTLSYVVHEADTVDIK